MRDNQLQRSKLEQFFELGAELAQSLTVNCAGNSGLGMHIMQNLATVVLGGGISLDSKPGAGASVRLVFPRVAPQEQGQERGAG